jgi:hypothetical protein
MLASISQSSAVQILQHASRLSVSAGTAESAGAQLVATANGVTLPAGPGDGGPAQKAKAKLSAALFKPNAPSVTEMKIHLMKRLGEQLGVALDDYETHAAFGAALRDAIADIKLKPNGALVLAAIERKLGFDKLGFSLDTFVSAIIDPKSDEGQKVDEALKKDLGLDGDDAKDIRAGARASPHVMLESGLYQVASVRASPAG